MKRKILGPAGEGKLSPQKAKEIVEAVYKRKTQHVVPNANGSGWNLKRGGATKATKHFETKEEAVQYARKVSANQYVPLIVHGKDGKIQKTIPPK